jgi:hypothetical protein
MSLLQITLGNEKLCHYSLVFEYFTKNTSQDIPLVIFLHAACLMTLILIFKFSYL